MFFFGGSEFCFNHIWWFSAETALIQIILEFVFFNTDVFLFGDAIRCLPA